MRSRGTNAVPLSRNTDHHRTKDDTVASELESQPSAEAWAAIQGAYDLQVHVSPDLVERRTDDVDLAHDFLNLGLSGFVLKSHYVPTGERAAVVRRAVPGVAAFGAVALNHGVGGLNPVAVDIAGRSGARIVWLPTVDSLNEAENHPSSMPNPPVWVTIRDDMKARGWLAPPIRVLDDAGEPVPALLDCLDAAAAHDMIVATGHLSRTEIFKVVDVARSRGIDRIVITHPEFPTQALDASDQVALAERGAVLEHCFTTAHTGKCTWEEMIANIKATGPEHVVLSTDLGQMKNPPVAEGLGTFAQRLLDAGFSVDDVQTMTARTTARLLGMDGEGRR
jgi:hypothetical protein